MSDWPELLRSYVESPSGEIPQDLFWEFERLVASVARRYPAKLYSPTGGETWDCEALDTVSVETFSHLIKKGTFVRLYHQREPKERIKAYLWMVVRRALRAIYEFHYPNHAKMYERIRRVLGQRFANLSGQFWGLRGWQGKIPLDDFAVDKRLRAADLEFSQAKGQTKDESITAFLQSFFCTIEAPVRLGKIVAVVVEYFNVTDPSRIKLHTANEEGQENDAGKEARLFEALPGGNFDPAAFVHGFEIGEVVSGFLSKLTDRQLNVFWYYYIEGLKLEDVANLTRYSTSTVGDEKKSIERLLGPLSKYFTDEDKAVIFCVFQQEARERRKEVKNDKGTGKRREATGSSAV